MLKFPGLHTKGRGMGASCKGMGSGGPHHFVDGRCTKCGCKQGKGAENMLNEPRVKTNTKATADDSQDRGGREDIRYPHEEE